MRMGRGPAQAGVPPRGIDWELHGLDWTGPLGAAAACARACLPACRRHIGGAGPRAAAPPPRPVPLPRQTSSRRRVLDSRGCAAAAGGPWPAAPAGSLEVYPLLGLDALPVRVLYLPHLRDKVGRLDQLLARPVAGKHDVEAGGPAAHGVEHVFHADQP